MKVVLLAFFLGIFASGCAHKMSLDKNESRGPSAAAQDGSGIGDEVPVVRYDFNKDGIGDMAILSTLVDGDYAPFSIRLGDANGRYHEVVTIHKLVSNSEGDMGGGPSLGLQKNGTIVVSDGNDAIGRNRWNKTYKFAYRGGKFILVGYSASDRDTLSGMGVSCDINFLSGKAYRNGKPVAARAEQIDANSVSEDFSPKICNH